MRQNRQAGDDMQIARTGRWIRSWKRLLPALPVLLWACPGTAGAASPAPVAARDGMVVSESREASIVGARVLAGGGNAVDAAIAAAFALAVCHPQAGNIGGGGFMIIRMADGTATAVDFRERAPGRAERDMFLGPDGRPDPALSVGSALGVAIPGTVAGMEQAHTLHGTMTWSSLLEPAIQLAEEGFVLDRAVTEHLALYRDWLGRHPETSRILLKDGRLFSEGDTLRQPDLAQTLWRIAQKGAREFYEGRIAAMIVRELRSQEGIITSSDLRSYQAETVEPLSGRFRDLTVLSMPPPSSGGIALLQMMGILERLPLEEKSPLSSGALHLMTESMKRAFADRAEFLGDPEFSPVPVAGLLDSTYIDSLAHAIDAKKAAPSLKVAPGTPHGAAIFHESARNTPGPEIRQPGIGGVEGRQTTHLSIVDREGNAVSLTTTLNTSYGTGIMVTGAGFLLNNEMDDFAAAPGEPNFYGLVQSEANAVRPNARPLSSMTPTIALRGDTLAYVLGSPGGPRIITGVLQTLINMELYNRDVQEAVDLPRIHHQWLPDSLYVEARGTPLDVLENLERMGHKPAASDWMGSVQAIQAVVRDGRIWYLGGSDSRRDGCAVGVQDGRLIGRCAGFLDGR